MEKIKSYSTPHAAEYANDYSIFSFNDYGHLVVEHAAILWSNFGGNKREGLSSNSDKRTVNLVLSDDFADRLASEGWNVRERSSNREDEPSTKFTELVLNPESEYPPKVWLLNDYNGDKTRQLIKTDAELKKLDGFTYSDITIEINPYVHGRKNSAGTTIKGYITEIVLVQQIDNSIMDKYAEYRQID